GTLSSLWSLSRIVYCSFPEPTGDLFRAASDEVLVVVELAGSDTQNLEHCIGEVGVPAAGTEADLSEDLPMAETEPRECFGGSDELIETVIIPPRNQFVPDPLDLRGITLPHRLLQLGQLQHRVQGQIVGLCDLPEQRREVFETFSIEGFTGELDDGGPGRIGQRV